MVTSELCGANHEHFSGFSAWIIYESRSEGSSQKPSFSYKLVWQSKRNSTKHKKISKCYVNCQFQLLPTFGIICVFKRFVIPFLLWRLMKLEAFWRSINQHSELIARFGLRRLSQALAFPEPKKRRRHRWSHKSFWRFFGIICNKRIGKFDIKSKNLMRVVKVFRTSSCLCIWV